MIPSLIMICGNLIKYNLLNLNPCFKWGKNWRFNLLLTSYKKLSFQHLLDILIYIVVHLLQENILQIILETIQLLQALLFVRRKLVHPLDHPNLVVLAGAEVVQVI